MPGFLKTFFVILGALLIGVGVGLIIAENFTIKESYYWLLVIFSLILGGFFLGYGIVNSNNSQENTETQSSGPQTPISD